MCQPSWLMMVVKEAVPYLRKLELAHARPTQSLAMHGEALAQL
jgi:hypothetical protein